MKARKTFEFWMRLSEGNDKSLAEKKTLFFVRGDLRPETGCVLVFGPAPESDPPFFDFFVR